MRISGGNRSGAKRTAAGKSRHEEGKKMELSKRLLMTASMVDPGSVAADVGCDHGYTAIWLVKNGICPRVLAMDVNAGPLARAEEHIREAGLSAYIETRLSDGLAALEWADDGKRPKEAASVSGRRPEADTLLMAGLGGRLAARILEDAAPKLARMRTVILQPQSELWLVRRTLFRLGYRITAEDMVVEDGRFYTAIRAENTRKEETGCGGFERPAGLQPDWERPEGLSLSSREWKEAGERYGFCLIRMRHPVLLAYLEEMLRKNSAARAAILAGPQAAGAAQETERKGETGRERTAETERTAEAELVAETEQAAGALPERSRRRLQELAAEAELAETVAAWMRQNAQE